MKFFAQACSGRAPLVSASATLGPDRVSGSCWSLTTLARRSKRSPASASALRAAPSRFSSEKFDISASALLVIPLKAAFATDNRDVDGAAHGLLLGHDALLEDIEAYELTRGLGKLVSRGDLEDAQHG